LTGFEIGFAIRLDDKSGPSPEAQSKASACRQTLDAATGAGQVL